MTPTQPRGPLLLQLRLYLRLHLRLGLDLWLRLRLSLNLHLCLHLSKTEEQKRKSNLRNSNKKQVNNDGIYNI